MYNAIYMYIYMNKYMYICNGILHRLLEEGNSDIHSNMDSSVGIMLSEINQVQKSKCSRFLLVCGI
jgi:hypothetical protein